LLFSFLPLHDKQCHIQNTKMSTTISTPAKQAIDFTDPKTIIGLIAIGAIGYYGYKSITSSTKSISNQPKKVNLKRYSSEEEQKATIAESEPEEDDIELHSDSARSEDSDSDGSMKDFIASEEDSDDEENENIDQDENKEEIETQEALDEICAQLRKGAMEIAGDDILSAALETKDDGSPRRSRRIKKKAVKYVDNNFADLFLKGEDETEMSEALEKGVSDGDEEESEDEDEDYEPVDGDDESSSDEEGDVDEDEKKN